MRPGIALLIVAITACSPAASPGPAPAQSATPVPPPPAAASPQAPPAPQTKPAAPLTPGQARIQEAKQKAAEIRGLFGEALKAVKAGKKEEALDLLDKVLEKAPDHGEAVAAKVELCLKEKLHEEALASLDRALARSPDSESFQVLAASVLLEKGEHESALQRLQNVIEKHPRATEARFLRARIHARRGDAASTLASLEDAYNAGFDDVARIQNEPSFSLLARNEKFLEIVNALRVKRDTVVKQLESVPQLPNPAEFKAPDAPREGRPLADLRAQLQANLLDRKSFLQDYDWKLVDGKKLKLGDFDKQPALIQFFGTWSPNSRRQLHAVEEVKKEYAAKGVAFLTLCYEFSAVPGQDEFVEESIRASLKSEGVDLPCVFVKKGTCDEFGVDTYPTTVLLAPGRVLCLSAPGFNSADTLKQLLEVVIAAGPAPQGSPPPAK